MTPLDLAQNLAKSDKHKDQVLGVAILARGLSDDDGLRQGWPIENSVAAAITNLGLTPSAALVEDALALAPTLSDAILNKGAADATDR